MLKMITSTLKKILKNNEQINDNKHIFSNEKII